MAEIRLANHVSWPPILVGDFMVRGVIYGEPHDIWYRQSVDAAARPFRVGLRTFSTIEGAVKAAAHAKRHLPPEITVSGLTTSPSIQGAVIVPTVGPAQIDHRPERTRGLGVSAQPWHVGTRHFISLDLAVRHILASPTSG